MNSIKAASPETLKEFGRGSAKIRVRLKGKPAGTGEIYQGQVKIQGCKTCR